MKKSSISSKRVLLLLLIVGLSLMFVLVPTHETHAWNPFSLDNIAGGVVGWIAYIVIFIATTIAGVVIAFETYLIGVVLQLSNNLVNTLAVQSGFQVTLAVANLGFILAIIIIALATILRRETYGIKKSLWKLIVAAILVNFSLIIG